MLAAAALVGAGAPPETDLFLSGLVLYAPLAEGSAEAKEHGIHPEVTSYDRHGGLAPDRLDAVVVANGRHRQQATIVLEVIAVVGLTNWAATEGSTDTQLLEASKVALPPVLRLEKSTKLDGRKQVEFSNIDLKKIIDGYVPLGFWPAALVFRATIIPIAGETSLQNNVMELSFPMRPGD